MITPTIDSRRFRAAKVIIICGLIINGIAIAVLVAIAFHGLWGVPSGTPIRPMGLAILQLIGSAAALFLSFILSLAALILGYQSPSIWIAAALLFFTGMAPFAAGKIAFQWIVDAHSLQVEE